MGKKNHAPLPRRCIASLLYVLGATATAQTELAAQELADLTIEELSNIEVTSVSLSGCRSTGVDGRFARRAGAGPA